MSQSLPQQSSTRTKMSSRSILPSINIPQICCNQVNHFNRGLEFICMGRRCMQYSKNVICFYCLQQSHKQHKDDINSIQQFLIECNQLIIQAKKKRNVSRSNNNLQSFNNNSKQVYQLQSILLNNIPKCSTKQQLTMLLQQIYRAVYLINNNNNSNNNDNNNNNNNNSNSNGNSNNNNKKKDKLVNEQIRQIKVNNERNYFNIQRGTTTSTNDKLNQQQLNQNILISINKQSNKLITSTTFYQPILSFINNTSTSQHFSFLSPFQIRHNKSQTISTCLLYPSLNTYNQSIQTVIKIVKSTPNWIAVGLYIGNNSNSNNNNDSNIYKYEQSSKNHISLLSNGWINIKSQQLRQQKHMIFHTGHQVKIKLDKQKKLIIFNNLTTKNQYIVRFQPLWNQDIYLFVSMYYQNDTVSIVQSAIVY